MSYNPIFEASRALPVEYIAKELEDFAAAGQDLSGRRFSRSPPRVSSVPSTKYEESESPSPHEKLLDKETLELGNSTASRQFNIQTTDELGRICAARDKNLLQHRLSDLEQAAEANVKYRWIQQGIWDESWDSQPSGKTWKHELQDPPSPVEPSDSINDGGLAELRAMHKRGRSKLEEEYCEISRRAVNYQDQQSSRPCYQFLYQFCQERQWIKMGLSDQAQDQETNLDTRAYENLKSRWIREGIWDDDWTFVPGTSWRHERPRKTLDESYRWEDARKAARIEQAERAPRWYPMAPAPSLLRMYWPKTKPVFLEAVSDSSSPSILEPSSKVKPIRNRSRTSRAHSHAGFFGSPRKSTAISRSDSKSQEHGEPRTKSATNKETVPSTSIDPKKKSPQKKKIDTSQSCVADTRPTKRRTSANKKKNGLQRPVVRPTETVNDTAASRPRRAAALKAMKNLTRTA